MPVIEGKILITADQQGIQMQSTLSQAEVVLLLETAKKLIIDKMTEQRVVSPSGPISGLPFLRGGG